jgi:hypothetical protein
MFTVKVVKFSDNAGNATTSIYEARSVDVIDTADQKAVIANFSNGEVAYIPVIDLNKEELADTVYIENANGKTTEIVRK